MRGPQTNRTRRIAWLCLKIGGVLAVPVALVLLFTWPTMLVSRSRQLTGVAFDLDPLFSYTARLGYSDGYSYEAFRIPAEQLDLLRARRESLAEYPMWSSLGLDEYSLVRWRPCSEVTDVDREAICVALMVPDDVSRHGTPVLPEVGRPEDVKKLALGIFAKKDSYFSYWQYDRGSIPFSHCYLYILGLEDGVLLKIIEIT